MAKPPWAEPLIENLSDGPLAEQPHRWPARSASPLCPSREEVPATVNEPKDLDLGADAVDQAVAGDQQFATRQAELRYDTAHLRGLDQQIRGFFQALNEIRGRLRGVGLLREVLDRMKEILPGRKGPNYRSPSHSRASRIA